MRHHSCSAMETVFDAESKWQVENKMNILGLPIHPSSLGKLDELLLELKRQKECWMYTHKLDQMEIQDSINRVQKCIDYIEFMQFKEYNNTQYENRSYDRRIRNNDVDPGDYSYE